VLLDPGEYRIQIGARHMDGGPLPELAFRLLGDEISEPAGPPLIVPSQTPVYACPPPQAGNCFPGGIVTSKPTIVVAAAAPVLPSATTIVFAPPPDWWFWSSTVERTNRMNPTDVNNDNLLTPLDALLIINELNASGTHAVPPPPVPFLLMDVNGDQLVSPLDAILVINRLNAATAAEGESGVVATVPDQAFSESLAWLAAESRLARKATGNAVPPSSVISVRA
jgi:hypothetical protein